MASNVGKYVKQVTTAIGWGFYFWLFKKVLHISLNQSHLKHSVEILSMGVHIVPVIQVVSSETNLFKHKEIEDNI